MRLQPGHAARSWRSPIGRTSTSTTHGPWKLAKGPGQAPLQEDSARVALNLFRQMVDLSRCRVLPKLAAASRELAARSDQALDAIDSSRWSARPSPIIQTPDEPRRPETGTSHDRSQPRRTEPPSRGRPPAQPHLPRRAEPRAGRRNDGPGRPLAAEPLAATCTIDDFTKVDLRVARVVAAEEVPEAKKLLRLTLSLGGDDEAERVRRDQERVQAGRTGRPAGDLRGQPATAANEVRPQRRDGRRGRRRRTGRKEIFLLASGQRARGRA